MIEYTHRSPRRLWIAGLAAATTAGTTTLLAQSAGVQSKLDDGSPQRIREGRQIGPVVGEVVRLATRWTFRPTTAVQTGAAEMPTMTCLENLMLQRIVDSIQIDPADRFWQISATVTEFAQTNYLLLTTAQRAPRSDES